MRTTKLVLVAVSILFLLSGAIGCGDDGGISQCVPGSSQTCACAVGVQGMQTCNEAGTYGACECETPPSDTTTTTDQGAPDGSDAADTASNDTGTDGTTTADTPADITEPQGAVIIGCDGIEQTLPVGFASARVEPDSPVLYSTIGDPAQQSFQLVYTDEAGVDTVMDDAVFLFQPVNLASIGASGVLNAHEGQGGAGQLQLIRAGVCLETEVTIIAVANHFMEGVPESIVDGYPTELPDPGEEPAIDLVYPLDNSAWPSNFPAMQVQWFKGDETTITNDLNATFRIDIIAPYKHIYIYVNGIDAMYNGNSFAVQIPPLAWTQIWSVDGGSPHQITVSAQPASSSSDTTLSVSTPRTVHFTADILGGSVVYWNNYQNESGQSVGRIRELDMETTAPIDVPIEGGCHGCHSVSPDANTIAVSFNTSTEWSNNTWSMQLFNMEDGEPVDWIHEDAATFIAETYTWQASFSDAYWNEETKHMVVSQGGAFKPILIPGFPTQTTTPQQLFSVDLLNGTSQAITGTTPEEDGWFDTFPAFSSDGQFVIFVRTDTLGMLGVAGESHLYRVEYNGGLAGSAPYPVLGGDLPEELQYYPTLTPDNQYIVYNRLGTFTEETLADCPNKTTQGMGSDKSTAQSYNNCQADLWMISASGGDPIRLDNASGADGLPYANSWPSVGMEVIGQHYWVAFSSYRAYGVIQNSEGLSEVPQIWLTAINPYAIMNGEDPSFAPIWLPSQDLSGNHIGQWTVTREP
jgi:hypothetical protein